MEGVIGYVTLFAGNFSPKNWAFCAGQTINISSNTALFSILGTTYGGNGTSTFALPDLRGRAVVGAGQGPGLSYYDIGQEAGVESLTLSQANMPAHIHALQYTSILPAGSGANTNVPTNNVFSVEQNGKTPYASPANTALKPYSGSVTMSNTGSSTPISILNPFLALNYIICQYGVYPSRN